MKVLLPLILFVFYPLASPQAHQPYPGMGQGGFQGNRQAVEQKRELKVKCTPDSLLFYYDCKTCVCPKPNRAAKCFKKSCDLRTKDSGQCPPAILRMDDSKLCHNPKPGCKVDNDCPGQQLCCFDFCNGAQCYKPIALDPGVLVHGGRGYP